MFNVFFGTLETVLMCKHSEYFMIIISDKIKHS